MSRYESYTLTPATIDDLPVLLEWRNSDRIRPFMDNDHIITMEEHTAFFHGLKDNAEKMELVFRYEGKPIGQLSVTRIDRKNGTAYWGYSRGERDAPHGSGTAMEYLALEFIFDELGIRKLCGELFAFNTSVRKVHAKFGWTEEGRLIAHRLKDGVYADVICIAMFQEHWDSIQAKMRAQIFED